MVVGAMVPNSYLIQPDEPILITGASGFIGGKVVAQLLKLGFRNLCCLVRPGSSLSSLEALGAGDRLKVVRGNLLSKEDCLNITKGVAVVIHLAAGRGEKSFPDAYMNSVVTTRNLLDAVITHGKLKRFVNVSSFAVYSNRNKPRRKVLDESCPMESDPHVRGEAYCYAKVRQDELVMEYGKTSGLPYVIVRPGYVLGTVRHAISGRVGIDTFGPFLHMGGSNRIPFTFVDNCADAVILAALRAGIDGEVFNVVDDDLPTSRSFLRQYKRKVRNFRSIYVPHFMSYLLCRVWEKYSSWSEEQLPPAFNVSRWHANWKKTEYSNEKIKRTLGWVPKVPMSQSLDIFFEGCRAGK